MTDYVGALDQGTSSTRFAVFDRAGRPIAIDQREHRQVHPRPGWVEHDPVEILAEAYAAGDREATRADPQGAAAASRLTRR